MPIAIECDSCHQTYNVGDTLAGKRVKCKACGNPILVPGFEPVAAPPMAPINECLSCGKTLPPETRICSSCGFNADTGEKQATLLELAVEDVASRRKRRSWERDRGNPLLETLDGFFKLLVLLGLIAGIVVTMIHLFNMPGGFDAMDLLPMAVVLLVIGAIMAPITAFTIKFAVSRIRYAPRDDTYTRVVIAMLLPFIAALIVGWKESADWNWIVTLSWLVATLLLVYFFRSDMVEWFTSMIAAITAILIAFFVVSVAANLLASATEQLNGDALPVGPWGGLAKGHSSPPKVAATRPVTPGQVATPNPGGPVDTPPSGTGPAPAVATGGGQAPTTNGQPLTRPIGPPPAKLESPLLAEINPDARFKGVRDIIVPVTPGDFFLAVRDSDNTTTVERWSAGPLEKKELATYPLFTKKPPQFAISPKGGVMATLQFFPRSQIDLTTFDGKTPKISIPNNSPADPQATPNPSLLGFLDEKNFCVRLDLNGTTGVQIFSSTGGEVRRLNVDPINPEPSATIISPNGKLLAAVGRGQIFLYPLDKAGPPHRIAASDLPVRLLALAFSPDSSQIAMYAAIDGLPTLMAFKVSNGDLAYTHLLSQSALDKDAPAMPHALIWLASSQSWLINGTDFFDPVAGRKLALLSVPPLLDVQLISNNTLAFILHPGDDPAAVTFAKPNDAALRKGPN